MGIIKKRIYKFYNPHFDTSVVFDNANYVINQIDLGSIDANLSLYAGAGQYGKTITNRALGTRDVYIKGYIVTDTDGEMAKLKHHLETVILPLYDFDIIVDGKYRLGCTAQSTLQYSKKWKENNQIICKFELDATCANPFFETLNPVNAEITSWIKDFHFPRSFPQGERFTFGHQNPTKVSVVTNVGDAPSSLIISFKAINGTVVNPWIRKADEEEYIYIETTIESGDTVEVSTEYGNKYIRNTDTGENLLGSLHLTSTFITVPTGNTTFTFGCDESSTGTLQCFIQYVPKLVVV